MRTSKENKKLSEPGTRRLTIQPTYYSTYGGYTKIPQIRLQGKWLEELGFSLHKRVKVTTEKNRLIIQVE